jgi:hypothetical protein
MVRARTGLSPLNYSRAKLINACSSLEASSLIQLRQNELSPPDLISEIPPSIGLAGFFEMDVTRRGWPRPSQESPLFGKPDRSSQCCPSPT